MSETDRQVGRRRKPFALWVVLGVMVLLAFLILALERSKARAEWIQCANMLCSLELAARTYAIDCNGAFAPNLQCMSNEISTTKFLICPSDRSRLPALNFSVLSPTNVSYVYLAVNLQTTDAWAFVTNAIFRCPIHGHTVYGDGRIVRGDGTIQYGKSLF